MPSYKRPNVKDVLRKHGAKIEGQIKTSNVKNVNYSQEYVKFKNEMAPGLTRYERWCHSLGSLIKLKLAKKDEDKIKKQLEIAHLELEPWQALTLGVMTFVGVFLLGLLASVAIALIKASGEQDLISGAINNFPFLFFFLMVVLSLFLFSYLITLNF